MFLFTNFKLRKISKYFLRLNLKKNLLITLNLYIFQLKRFLLKKKKRSKQNSLKYTTNNNNVHFFLIFVNILGLPHPRNV